MRNGNYNSMYKNAYSSININNSYNNMKKIYILKMLV